MGNALSELRAVNPLAVPIVGDTVKIVILVVSRAVFAADGSREEFLLLGLYRVFAFLGRGADLSDSYVYKPYKLPVSFGTLEDAGKEVSQRSSQFVLLLTFCAFSVMAFLM